MSMTKHDYDRLARSMDDVSCELMQAGLYEKVLTALAETLEANNDNFDRAVFLAKCGVKI